MIKKSEIGSNELKKLMGKIIVRFFLIMGLLMLITLLPAGTFDYWQFYVYVAVLIIPMLFVFYYFFQNDPQFLERRIRVKEKEKTQKFVQIIYSVIFFSAFIVSGLDRRFLWSDVPFSLILIADAVVLFGYILIFFVFKENSFASRVVEVEAQQKVITTGLYSIVRHPMYVGVVIMYLPTPLALGSYWGLFPMATIPTALILRLLNEEAVLMRELPEYKEYCQKTKYRLIPYIW